MSLETEKMFKQLHKFLEGKVFENQEEANKEIQKFMNSINSGEVFGFDEQFRKEEESDDLLFMAYEEPNIIKAINYAKKSLKVNPDNIDAMNFLVSVEPDEEKQLEMYKENIQTAKKILDKNNMFDKENIGQFWGITETRPYMRTRQSYMLKLFHLKRYDEAIKECEELLKLCKNDNLGVRYILIGLYVYTDNFNKAEKLYKKFKEDSTFMLLPLCIMYYKQGDFNEAEMARRKVNIKNSIIFELLNESIKLSKKRKEELEHARGYALGSLEEAYLVLKDLKYLIDSTEGFKEWIKTKTIII